MALFYLIRHGENDLVGRGIAGRRPGTHLNAAGQAQAERLARHLSTFPIHHLFSSPMERARETAEPLARALGLPVEICEALNEIDFGDWTGKTFAELELQPAWKQWKTLRSLSRIPNGESMLEVQGRVVGELERLRRRYPDQHLALFSHGDPLRSAIAHYLGLPLDLAQRLEISPASVTVLSLGDWGVKLEGLNREAT
jgi:broad specificity phosphatase PhoE